MIDDEFKVENDDDNNDEDNSDEDNNDHGNNDNENNDAENDDDDNDDYDDNDDKNDDNNDDYDNDDYNTNANDDKDDNEDNDDDDDEEEEEDQEQGSEKQEEEEESHSIVDTQHQENPLHQFQSRGDDGGVDNDHDKWLTRPAKFVLLVWIATFLAIVIIYSLSWGMVDASSHPGNKGADVVSRGPAVLLRSATAQEDMCAAFGITFTPYLVLFSKTVLFQLFFLFYNGGPQKTWEKKRKPLGWWGASFAAYQLLAGLFNFGSVYVEYVRAKKGGGSSSTWDSYQWYLLLMVQSSFYETGLQFLAEVFFLLQGLLLFGRGQEREAHLRAARQRLRERGRERRPLEEDLSIPDDDDANDEEEKQEETCTEEETLLQQLARQPYFWVYHVMLETEVQQRQQQQQQLHSRQRRGEDDDSIPHAAPGTSEMAPTDESGVTEEGEKKKRRKKKKKKNETATSRKSTIFKHLVFPLLLSTLIAPAIIVNLFTHVLPMTLAFVWMGLLGFLLIPAIVAWLPQLLGGLQDEARAMWGYLCWKTCLVLFGTLTFQSTVTYGILLYDGEAYMNVLRTDWKLRSIFTWAACIESAVTGRLTTVSDVLALV